MYFRAPNEPLLVEDVEHLFGAVSILTSFVPQVSTQDALLSATYLVLQAVQAVALVQVLQSVIELLQAVHSMSVPLRKWVVGQVTHWVELHVRQSPY